jgi:hypothetical protein
MDQTQQMMRFAMRCVAVLVIPLTAKFEAGVHVYWLTSNGLAVLQASAGGQGRDSAAEGVAQGQGEKGEVGVRRCSGGGGTEDKNAKRERASFSPLLT